MPLNLTPFSQNQGLRVISIMYCNPLIYIYYSQSETKSNLNNGNSHYMSLSVVSQVHTWRAEILYALPGT